MQIDELQARFPWPADHPNVQPIDWSLDGGGRWMVQQLLRRRNLKVVLEIGVFLGGSVRNWLSSSDDVVVVAVDPWPDSWDVASIARKMGKSDEVIAQLSAPDGMYKTFLANLWDQQSRVIPVREYSPGILHQLCEMGLQPDLIYLDSDKTGDEIELCHQLFPNAIMTGDDWGWCDESGGFPIRKPVEEFCRVNNRYLRVENATWVIDTQPASASFRLRTFRRSLQAKWKSIRRRVA